MFDNVCKFLAENFSTDFASWLLGVNLLNSGMALEEVARMTGLSLQEVELLLKRESEA